MLRVLETLKGLVRPRQSTTPAPRILYRHTNNYRWRIRGVLWEQPGQFDQGWPSRIDEVSVRNVTSLFAGAGINTPWEIFIEEAAESYPVESNPKDNWLYASFRGFAELQKRLIAEQKACRRFATIGTGPGIDAIGAHYIFGPEWTELTDLNEQVLEIALSNLRNNIPEGNQSNTASVGHLASVIEPPVDVLYANLPNIPAAHVNMRGSIASASYVDRSLLPACTPEIDHYRLALQYALLQSATPCLAPNGSVLIALGARMPFPVIQRLFAEAGYTVESVFQMLKRQTQPEEVITGYAAAEEAHGVTFSYYDLDAIPENLRTLESTASEPILQDALASYSVSAQDALRASRRGKNMGHIVSILRGQNFIHESPSAQTTPAA